MRTLEPLFEDERGNVSLDYEINARQAWAWSWQQSGDPARAATELQVLQRHFEQLQRQGLLEYGDDVTHAEPDATPRD